MAADAELEEYEEAKQQEEQEAENLADDTVNNNDVKIAE